MTPLIRLACFVVCVGLAARAHATIEHTAHNLMASGPGRIKGEPEANLCVFCHTPHNAKATRGLWNHQLPAQSYKLYDSTTTHAQLQQPTGSSRLCLSCHDGTIALGALAQHPEPRLGALTGATVLGTDLSDDHPISFIYDQALVVRQPQLADPTSLPPPVKLDETHQMQCTSCHDPHSDRFPNFLVTDVSNSTLCVACHRLSEWSDSIHATSPAVARGPVALPGAGFKTVAENGCLSCHTMHAAAHPVRLLSNTTEAGVCLQCHNGMVAQTDLRSEFLKPSAHAIDRYPNIHDAAENPLSMNPHVECVDCHNPHQTRRQSIGGQIPGALTGVSGVDISGGVHGQANFDYEMCLKCHGVSESPSPLVVRADNITNVRLKIDPASMSFHPIAAPGRNPAIRGLLAGLTPLSVIRCTDCHNNNAVAANGGAMATSPRGPHGSMYAPILAREYGIEGTAAAEAFQQYALCYSCHDRTQLFGQGSTGFVNGTANLHALHVQSGETGCAVCHDAHGSRRNLHLINFMQADRAGTQVVTAITAGSTVQPILYQAVGLSGGGSCTLSCHGGQAPADHNGTCYGSGCVALSPAALRHSVVPAKPAGASAPAPGRLLPRVP